MNAIIPRDRQFGLLRELEQAGALTPVSLDLADETMSLDRWLMIGSILGSAHRSLAFLIGDWLIFGEGVYGEKYAQGEAVTGLRSATLMTYAWVCRSVPKGRRRPELPFSAHRAVAALDAVAQRRWLDRAVREGWRGEDLARAIKEQAVANGDEPRPEVENVSTGIEVRAVKTRALLERAIEELPGDTRRDAWGALDEISTLEKAAGARAPVVANGDGPACPECGRPLGEEE